MSKGGNSSCYLMTRLMNLFLNMDSSKVCSLRPNGVQENPCFVIDLSQLTNAADSLVSDVGSFQNLGAIARRFGLITGNMCIVNRYVAKKAATSVSSA